MKCQKHQFTIKYPIWFTCSLKFFQHLNVMGPFWAFLMEKWCLNIIRNFLTGLPNMGLKSIMEAWWVWHVTQPIMDHDSSCLLSQKIILTEGGFWLVHTCYPHHLKGNPHRGRGKVSMSTCYNSNILNLIWRELFQKSSMHDTSEWIIKQAWTQLNASL